MSLKKKSVPLSPLEEARRKMNNAMRWMEVHRRQHEHWKGELKVHMDAFQKLYAAQEKK